MKRNIKKLLCFVFALCLIAGLGAYMLLWLDMQNCKN